jgi:hypothetical protein
MVAEKATLFLRQFAIAAASTSQPVLVAFVSDLIDMVPIRSEFYVGSMQQQD